MPKPRDYWDPGEHDRFVRRAAQEAGLEQTTLFGAPPRQRCDPNKRHMVKATEAQKPAPKPGWRPAQTLEERRREAKAIERERAQEVGD